MPRTPLVSVLLPSYNYARYLPQAIESVLAQDLRELELVLVDDGSTDGSPEIIRRYAAGDGRVQALINPRNIGMVANWNLCLARARGEYVKPLLADDYLGAPSALTQWVRLLESEPSVVLAASAREIVDDQSRRLRVKGFARDDRRVPGAEAIARCVGSGSNLIGEPSAVLFRRADAQRGFDASYRQLVDLEMWFHLLRRGDLAYTASCLCGFRKHGLQQSSLHRGTTLGRDELSALVRAYADTASGLGATWWRAAWAYRLRRIVPPGADAVDTRLGRAEALWRALYGLSRPWTNLERRRRAYR